MAKETGRPPHIHFWTDRRLDDLDRWRPDTHPDLFPSGYGHAFLELFVRLKDTGREVSIGRLAPATSTVLVASLEELTNWLPRCEPSLVRAIARDALRCRAAVVVIRGDLPPDIRAPSFTAREIMPTPRSVTRPHRQRYLPLLPQRGLIPRSPERGTRVTTMALKAYRKNIPAWLDDSFVAEAARIGVSVVVATDGAPGGSWADFRDVDVVLCSQPMETLGEPSRKPPTKLINAWCAGAIPIVVPALPYADIGVASLNMLAAANAEGVLEWLRKLTESPEFAARLFAGSRQAALDYERQEVVRMWWDAIVETQARSPSVTLQRLVVEYLHAALRRLTRLGWRRGYQA